MAEFREQDSYINSDHDSDSSTGPISNPYHVSSDIPVHNSLIAQAQGLVLAAQAYHHPAGTRAPRVSLVLNRLVEFPEGGYEDDRIPATFLKIRKLGVELVFGPRERLSLQRREHSQVLPTTRVLLDLSVVVALCCDSTHSPLPASKSELESRFRPLQMATDGKLALAPHTAVSRNLQDQLATEAQHPIVLEIKQQLSAALDREGGSLEFWVTQEVKNRLRGITDHIGGNDEQARAEALFSGHGFWRKSRWEGKAGVLTDIKLRVLDDGIDARPHDELNAFQRSVSNICEAMIDVEETPSIACTSSRSNHPLNDSPKTRWSKSSKRTATVFPASRLPSAHTLRTLLAGVRHRMTVLTNNRGAIGKILREMGMNEGHPRDEREDEKAVVWVVNPSSLAEWRRGEVKEQNQALKESLVPLRWSGESFGSTRDQET